MGVRVLPAPCPTDALAEGGRFWLVLGLGEFKPTLLKGYPDQHPPRCPGKVLRERRGSPGTAAAARMALHGPGTGLVPQCPTSPYSHKQAPGGSLSTRGVCLPLPRSSLGSAISAHLTVCGLQGLPARTGLQLSQQPRTHPQSFPGMLWLMKVPPFAWSASDRFSQLTGVKTSEPALWSSFALGSANLHPKIMLILLGKTQFH